jgi:hypothetical protein
MPHLHTASLFSLVFLYMGDSEFSSVHWDSPPPSSFPDHPEQNHVNNDLLSTTQTVVPEMDPLQRPPSNEHILICVCRYGD